MDGGWGGDAYKSVGAGKGSKGFGKRELEMKQKKRQPPDKLCGAARYTVVRDICTPLE